MQSRQQFLNALWLGLSKRPSPGIPCALVAFGGTRLMHHSGISGREKRELVQRENVSQKSRSSSPAKAGDPVRRGLSAQAPPSLECWIVGLQREDRLRASPGDDIVLAV
jgi:hypothetical protein